tara:strand:- start:2847 stop:3146 length:300 start_codon:yes stop_codon:yes gene_type:complete
MLLFTLSETNVKHELYRNYDCFKKAKKKLNSFLIFYISFIIICFSFLTAFDAQPVTFAIAFVFAFLGLMFLFPIQQVYMIRKENLHDSVDYFKVLLKHS